MSKPRELWPAKPDAWRDSVLGEYRRWLESTAGLAFDDYGSLWAWSVDDLEGFWRSSWEFFEVAPGPSPRPVLARVEMPGQWFPMVRVN